jgi:arsenate reductase
MKKVVFVCVHNSGRSQMAEAFANRLGKGKLTAQSAGTAPADSLNPTVVRAMQEIGHDMKGHYPKDLSPDMVDWADQVITMGCEVDAGVCPAGFVPSVEWSLDDPKGKSIGQVRQIRDEIRKRVLELIAELENEGQGSRL